MAEDTGMWQGSMRGGTRAGLRRAASSAGGAVPAISFGVCVCRRLLGQVAAQGMLPSILPEQSQ
jgi:hypothetical protein